MYNLGDFLSDREIPEEARLYMFKSLNKFPSVEKVIIEARAEKVEEKKLIPIRDAWNGVIEVGVGLESSDDVIRNLAHRKSVSKATCKKAMETLNRLGFNSLSYVNQKPPFLTEQESIDDVVTTTLWAKDIGCMAISIEPTAIQPNTLTEHLTRLGIYRVPWLYSVVAAVLRITETYKTGEFDLRIGGYFPEELVYGSSSAGAFPFPTLTSTNCPSCNPKYIQSFARFNETYNPEVLRVLPKCEVCYDTWESAIKVKDSRTLPERVFDILGSLDKKEKKE